VGSNPRSRHGPPIVCSPSRGRPRLPRFAHATRTPRSRGGLGAGSASSRGAR
jgi:hypothetical protein